MEKGEFIDAARQYVVYQYLCNKCGHITECEFPFGEAEPSVECKTEGCNYHAYKIISTPNILVGMPTHEARRGRGKG